MAKPDEVSVVTELTDVSFVAEPTDGLFVTNPDIASVVTELTDVSFLAESTDVSIVTVQLMFQLWQIIMKSLDPLRAN